MLVQPASLVPRRRSTHSSSALTRPRNSSSSACEEAAAGCLLLVGLGSRDRRRPGLIFVATELPWTALECARTNQPLCSCDETTIRRNGTAQYPISSSVDFQIEWNGVIDLAQSSSVLLQRLAVNWQVSNVYRKGLPLGQLIVVSNRVAVPERRTSARAGGLEVAVNAALKQKSGIWFGWSGKVAAHSRIATQKVVDKEITYITLDLSREDHLEYYSGFANRVLWPILHYRIDLAEFSRRDLGGYLRVNDNFAGELHKVLGPEDLVWVHDYHLMPLAKALRERGHRNRIGFFLHIPCPPPEVLTALPNHERLIPSLCDYDLVGFQTGDDAFNFSRYLTRECGLHSRDFNFVVADRTIRIDAFPVGIETAAFANLARNSVRLPVVKRVVKSSSAIACLSLGLTDWITLKASRSGFQHLSRFLPTQPEWRGKVTYLQIAPKSRTEIPEYADIEREIGSAAGHA